jgi:hypothetical protein
MVAGTVEDAAGGVPGGATREMGAEQRGERGERERTRHLPSIMAPLPQRQQKKASTSFCVPSPTACVSPATSQLPSAPGRLYI